MQTKKCKYCMTEIPKAAKVCPQCGRKQGGILKWIIIVVVVIIILGAIAGGGGNDEKTASSESATSESTSSVDTTNSKSSDDDVASEEEREQEITYTEYDVSELMDDLEANALSASEKYKGQYVEITGRLSNIDAQGSYIDIVDSNDQFAFIGVQCYIKTDDVREMIKTLSKDSTITVKGKITDVGEVFGYSLNIEEIIP